MTIIGPHYISEELSDATVTDFDMDLEGIPSGYKPAWIENKRIR
jgi:hypothetical protein